MAKIRIFYKNTKLFANILLIKEYKGTKPIHGMTKRTFPAHGKVKIQDKMFS